MLFKLTKSYYQGIVKKKIKKTLVIAAFQM